MRKGIVALGFLASSTGASGAQYLAAPEVLEIYGRGRGAWSIRCELRGHRGEPIIREIRGQGRDFERLTAMEPSGGNCSYQVSIEGPLTIRQRGGYVRCAFPTPDRRFRLACEESFPAGSSGQFAIRPSS